MKERTALRRAAVALSVHAALSLTACGGGAGDAPAAPSAPVTPTPPAQPTALALRVPVDTVRPGAVVRIVIPGGGAPNGASGTLGSAAFQAARVDDSTLVGLVPDLAPAVHTLRLTLGARAGEASVTVLQAPTIADPVAAVSAQLDAMTTRFAASTPPDGFSAAEWSRLRAVADSVGRDLRARMASATPAERLAVARLFASAGASSGSTSFAALKAGPVLTAACARQIASAAAPVQAVYVGLGAMVGGAAFGLTPAGAALFGVAGAAVYLQFMPDAVANVARLPEACYVGERIEAKPLATDVLESGRVVAVDVLEWARSMSGAEARQGAAATVTDGIDRVYAAVAALPSSVAGAITKLPLRLSTLPVTAAAARALDPQRVRLVSVSPSTVSATVSAASGGLTFTATTGATTDTRFTATLAHTDDPTLQTTVTGTVRPTPPIVVKLNLESATITGLQNTLKLTATVTGTTDTGVNWSSSDVSIATVASDGTVLGKASGTVTVRATSVADPSRSATARITVTSGIGITLSPTSATVVAGTTRRFTATLTGTNSTGVVWSSSNPAVATVTAAGDVTGLAIGTTTITATAAYDLSVSATASVLVSSAGVSVSIAPSSVTLQVGQTQALTAAVTGATVTSVIWTTSNAAVASVDGLTGVVTARANGTATITARSIYDVTKTGTATITVGSTGGGTTPPPSGGTSTSDAQCDATWKPVLTGVKEWSEASTTSDVKRFGWSFTAQGFVTATVYYADGDVSPRSYPYRLVSQATSPTGCAIDVGGGEAVFAIRGYTNGALQMQASGQAVRTLTR
ncbi:Ig domain protein group 2 domain protein [Gemmatirosa kalamazoonensis]|uniref:Ig domain protein group 2 domain protein n=1 Tax=Gemmatirosa kalamazoonensis TaxID=861299 RepID=W0RGA6_9BACT|nr:Ig-like domain-containing protein [Gemmatirosa kalamazoonensis]AHG89806.1 Ig domain protein group 2 domain protein [Gemmatirosa kalamazoonensis]